MPETAARQIDAIHSMLSAGHRNLRIERHSLILWGVAGGVLCFFSAFILTPEQLPDTRQRALAWLLLLSVVLGSVGIADWHLTCRVKLARAEAWSFIHRQVLKMWWLLMAMGTLLTFAMFFFGGGYMLYSAWLVLLGLGLYVHGLFSEELLEWVGVLVIAIGIISLAYRLPTETMRWICASVFAIGLPLLAAMLDRGRAFPSRRRLAQTLTWMFVVLALPLLGQRYAAAQMPPDAPVISLESFRQQRDDGGTRIVALPAGTLVPVEVELSGDLFDGAVNPVLPLKLAEPIEVLMVDGKLTGDIRFAGGSWLPAREARWIGIPWMKAELKPEQGPLVRAGLVVEFKRKFDE
ncbi:MAG: hypothetical protein PHX38_09970 [Sulfuricella sp.]|nr:hypothetical protein [Sulfuricella sp.]